MPNVGMEPSNLFIQTNIEIGCLFPNLCAANDGEFILSYIKIYEERFVLFSKN